MGCPFATLGLHSDADRDEVRKAFFELARKYHPDRAGSASGEKMAKLNAAYKEALRILEGGRRESTSSFNRAYGSQAPSSHHGSTSSSHTTSRSRAPSSFSGSATSSHRTSSRSRAPSSFYESTTSSHRTSSRSRAPSSHRDSTTSSRRIHSSRPPSSFHGSAMSSEEFRYESTPSASTSRDTRRNEGSRFGGSSASRSASRSRSGSSASSSYSAYGDGQGERTPRASHNPGYASSSGSFSSRRSGRSSQVDWSSRSSRFGGDSRPSSYGGSSSSRDPKWKWSNCGWVTDAKGMLIRRAKDAEADFNLLNSQLERIHVSSASSARDRERYDRLKGQLRELDRRLEDCVVDVEELQDWIDEGNEMGYFW